MANRKKSVLEIIAREGRKKQSVDGYVRRGIILHELGDRNLPTHPKLLDIILQALERADKIESHISNRIRVPRRRRYRIRQPKQNT